MSKYEGNYKSLKDTKIFIPNIPKEWTDRLRSGHTNIWNEGGRPPSHPEVRLEPPIEGLYAERYEDGWYWVCGCNECLENGKSYSYIVCDYHNKCIYCGTHRKELTDIPWGLPKGFQCEPCHDKERREVKEKAIIKAIEKNHSEWDCFSQDEIICPKCASINDSEYIEGYYEEITCYVCDTNFKVEVDVEVKYSTYKL